MKKIATFTLSTIIFLLYMVGNQSFSQVQVFDDENSDSIVFAVVEDPPEFPGGDSARIRFFNKNIVFPQMALDSEVQGTVYITFVIEKDGQVSNVQILRRIGSGCDEEAVRVVKLMPRWKPGKQRGKNVRVQYNLPIRFTLSKKNEKN